MRTYYVQIQCFYKDSFGKTKGSFIEEGMLDQYDEYLVYRDLRGNDPEVFDSMKSFKMDFVHDIKDFNKYVDMLELK
jgi:hypothetical protein